MEAITAGNQEAVEAWNGVLFDRFKQYRHLLISALGAHGDKAMTLHPPPAGGRVLDIGCGFGDTTQQLAKLIGPEGHAVGIDAAPRFIDDAIAEAAEAATENVEFFVTDVEREVPGGPYDYAFSRMGVMFFANPVAAFRNVRASMVPGGRICWVVWRQKIENEAMYRAEEIVEGFVGHPDHDDSDEPTCGPGPFSMANADTVSMQLRSAGFEDIGFVRSDIPMLQGRDLEEAIDLVTAIGPAGEVIRLAGDDAKRIEAEIRAELEKMMRDYLREDGQVWTPTSCWIVSAVAA
jgi:SAM-dependent methyltransferase